MKKSLFFRTLFTIAGMLVILLLVGYGCKNAQQKQGVTIPDELDIPDDNIEALTGYPLPTSYEITSLIYEAGATYNLELSNDPQGAANYITQSDKALNLGVYGADLCYASTYMMKQQTLFFLEATKTLIDELGINTTFHMHYAEKVESNLDDRDSIIHIVEDSFFDTWDHLVTNEQDILARLMVSGSWIEGMYITTNIAKGSRDNTTFMEILANQNNSLDKLVSLLEPVQDVSEISMIYQGLIELQGIYVGVEESLNEDQLELISSKIKELRDAIV